MIGAEKLAAPVSATSDLDLAKDDLDKHGYCLIAGALSRSETTCARERLAAQAKEEERRGIAFHDGGARQDIVAEDGHFKSSGFGTADGGVNQRLFMLINKGQCFRDMVIHSLVDQLVGHLLGKDFILSTLSANIARRGGVRMGLHTDQWWMPQPTRAGTPHRRVSDVTRRPAPEFVRPDYTLGIAPTAVATAVWMLSDFRADNGATEVVPGSHLSGAYPEPGCQRQYPITQAEAPAGTLMVFDGRLWHGTGANTAGPDRAAVLATFCGPQFRQQENQTLGLDSSLWGRLPDKLKARLGFKVWNGYGRIEKEFGGMVSPQSQRIGELGCET